MEKRQKIIAVAEKVKFLFGFCAGFIPDRAWFKETAKVASDRQSFATSAAPILEAFRENWEKAEFEARLKRDRANALDNLIATLDRTEKRRVEFHESRLGLQGSGRG
jgi:hypothetical protein